MNTTPIQAFVTTLLRRSMTLIYFSFRRINTVMKLEYFCKCSIVLASN